MSSLKSFLITGANRGLGLEMVKQIIPRYSPSAIFATCRDPTNAEDLLNLAKIHPCIHPVVMDITKPETFGPVIATIEKVLLGSESQGLDVLINNAGIFLKDGQTLESITKETMIQFLEVNTFGHLFVTQAFLPLLGRGGTKSFILNFSSRLGSIDDNKSGGYYASRTCRVATNAITKSMGIDLKDRNIIAISINPGWVQTDQGGPSAPLKKEESVEGILSVLDKLEPSLSGSFLQYDGTIVPW